MNIKNGIESVITNSNNDTESIYNFRNCANGPEYGPETTEYFKKLYSQNADIVAEMLHSKNKMDVAIARTVIEVAGIKESDLL